MSEPADSQEARDREIIGAIETSNAVMMEMLPMMGSLYAQIKAYVDRKEVPPVGEQRRLMALAETVAERAEVLPALVDVLSNVKGEG